MPPVRFKVTLDTVSHIGYPETTFKFTPVSNGSEENRMFSERVRGGELSLILTKEAVEIFKPFNLGQEYYVDFHPILTKKD